MTVPKVLAVNHTGLVSGAETVMLRLLEGARGRGWAAAAAIPDGALVEHVVARDIECVTIPDLMLPPGPRALSAASLARRYVDAARRLRLAAADVDVVVANGLRVLPVLRLARPRAPVVWLAQSVLHGLRWKLMLRASEGVVDSAVAVSQAVATSLGDRPYPVRVVWNGTAWPVAPAPLSPPDPPVIGCAALLTPWKGQEVLLEAVARLGRADVTVELMGGNFPKDAGYVEALRKRSEAPDLAGRVHFLGRLEDPLSRVRQWSVAVSSSVEPEAGPLTAIEAMSVGVPVIATNHGGAREVLADAGLLIPPGDADALSGAIRTVLDDRALHRRCAAAGPRLVASGLSLDRQLAVLLDTVGITRGEPVATAPSGRRAPR